MSVAPAARDGAPQFTRGGLPRRLVLATMLFAAAGRTRAGAADGAGAGQPGGKPKGKATSPAAPPADVALLCSPTLAAFIHQVAGAFATRAHARIAIFAAPPALILAGVERGVAGDVLVMTSAAMDQAVARKLADPATRRDGWRSTLVFACVAGTVPPFAANDPALLSAALGPVGRFALTDASDAASIDGPGVLNQIGMDGSVAGRMVGAADAAGVVLLLKTGAARLGLLYLTDVRANPGLAVACMLDPARVPATIYAVAVAQKPKSPNAKAFADLLCSREMAPHARAMGLEPA